MSANPVLIAGAGPTGLALALALLRNDIPVRIIQKDLIYRVGMRGPAIQPRILEMYKFLGILEEVMEASGAPQQIQRHAVPDDGQPPMLHHLSELGEKTPDCPYINYRNVPQDDHEKLLRLRLQKEYRCEVELGTWLESFEQYSDHVIAHIKRIKDGIEVAESTRAAYLIGADGAHSAVRKGLGCTFLGESPPAVALVTGDIHLKNEWGHQYLHSWGEDFTSAIVVLRPYPKEGDDRFQFLVGGATLDAVQISTNRETLVKAISDITGRTDFHFGKLICLSVWRPNIRMVDTFGKGRVFLAGDAAHVHSPTGGQGLNSGIQDSLNLAWKLSLVFKGLAPETILESYSGERLPVIAAMLDKTTLLFNKTFRATNKEDLQESWKRGSEFSQFGINYRGSSLVLDEKLPPAEILDPYRKSVGEPVRAGDRAPDAPGLVPIQASGEEVTSLFDIFKITYHTVLIFVGNMGAMTQVQKLLETLAAYPQGTVKSVLIYPSGASERVAADPTNSPTADFSFVDRDGYAYRHYAVDEEEISVIVVRPDGYVGALLPGSQGFESIKAYFGRFFIV